MNGYSGGGRAFNASFPIAPTLRRQPKANTTQNRIIIEGTRNSAYVQTGGVMLPLINYIDYKKWFMAAALTAGANSIAVRGYDNIYHKFSGPLSIDVTRHAIDVTNQPKAYQVSINGVEYTSAALKIDVDGNTNMVEKAVLEMSGNLLSDVNADFEKTVIIKFNDGFLDELVTVFEGRITEREFFIASGEKTTKLTALNNIIDALADGVVSHGIQAHYLGGAQKQLLTELGYTDLWPFDRHKYTGRRNYNNYKTLELLKEMCLANGEIIDIKAADTVEFVPDEYLQYPLFEFDESEIVELEINETAGDLINKINVVYGDMESNTKTDAVSLIDEPDTEKGFGFYADPNLKDRREKLPLNGSIYFATWNKAINYDEIEEAELLLVHTNDFYKISNLEYRYFLNNISDKKILFCEVNLTKLNLRADSQIQLSYSIIDSKNKYTEPSLTIELETVTDETDKIYSNMFDLLFSEHKELAAVDLKLYPTGAGETDSNKILANENDAIVYINKNEKQEVYEFLLQIPLEQNALLDTIDFNFAPNESVPDSRITIEKLRYTDAAYLKNCEIITADNAVISGNQFIRAASYIDNPTGFKIIDAIYILFKTDNLAAGEAVELKFKITGRQFINNDIFVDYQKLKCEAQDAASITKYGLKNGGYLISNFLANERQTETIAKKIVGFYASPLVKVKIKLPVISELDKNTMIKVNSPNSGIASYYFITGLVKSFEEYTAECILMRSVTFDRNRGVRSEFELEVKDANLSLSPFFNLFQNTRDIEKALVLVSHQNKTCDVKAYGSNIKYKNINYLANLKPKKNDKVLIATSRANEKIIIAIMESAVDAIDKKELDITEEGEESGGSGAALVTNKDREKSTTLEVDVVVDEITLWKEAEGAKNGESYTVALANCWVTITFSQPVPLETVAHMIEIKAKNTGKTPQIKETRFDKYKKYISYYLNCAYDTEYEVKVNGSQAAPIPSEIQGIERTNVVLYRFKTEPQFGIQMIKVLNPNVFEVVLTHPIMEGSLIRKENYLLY